MHVPLIKRNYLNPTWCKLIFTLKLDSEFPILNGVNVDVAFKKNIRILN